MAVLFAGDGAIDANDEPAILAGRVQKNGHPRVAVVMVEAAGQLIHLFRGGLDYAFILLPGCGASYPAKFSRILVAARRIPEGRIKND